MSIDRAVDSAVLDTNLTAIANAIREKGGTSDPIAFDAMAQAIAAIESAANTVNGKKYMTGTFTVSREARVVENIVSKADITDAFGYEVKGRDYKHIAGYYDEGAKSNVVNGALYCIGFLGMDATPHYYNESSISRASMSSSYIRLEVVTYNFSIAAYSATYGFKPGRVYRWFIMEA